MDPGDGAVDLSHRGVVTVTGPDRLYMRAPLFRALLARRPASEIGPPGFGDLIRARHVWTPARRSSFVATMRSPIS